MHEPHISLYHIGHPHISCSKTKSTMISCSKIKSTIYTCKNLNLALYYIYVYSNNVVQKLPCQMAMIQNSGSKRTYVCTHMNKKINLCTCPLYIISSYPLFCCHCQSLRRSWAFFCDYSLVFPIIEQEG